MPPHNSTESFRDANRQNDDANRRISHATADLSAAVRDIWGAGMNRLTGAGQAIGETANAAGHAIHQTYDAAGRMAQGVANEAVRENQDVARVIGQGVDATTRTARDFGHGVQQTSDAAGHAIHQTYDAAASTATAAGHRINDHYRDRPLTAIAEGLLGPVDGLMRGGINPRDRAPVAAERTMAQGQHPAPEAHPVAHAGGDQPHHHTVRSGESYWSIAAQQGGTRSQIAARTEQLRTANSDRALLPGLDIVGT